MQNLHSERSIPFDGGLMYLVKLPADLTSPAWLAQAQVELDGKRVFVRMVESATSAITGKDATTVGLVVSPVY